MCGGWELLTEAEVDDIECIECPNCKQKKVEQSCYSDGMNWLHCLDCGWINPSTDKP